MIVSGASVGAARLAAARGIECVVLDERQLGASRCDDEMALVLRARSVGLVVLAGYLRKVGPRVLASFAGRIINTHPAPLPRFGGKGMYGEHVHRVVLEVIAEESVPVRRDDDVTSLRARVQFAERRLLVETVAGFQRDAPRAT